MQNLAKAIEKQKISLVLAKSISRESQCIYSLPSRIMYFDELNRLTIFYENLNRYFLTHDLTHLTQCYQDYKEFEKEGWVIYKGKLINLVFSRLVPRLELVTEAWFYRYAISLDFTWLQDALKVLIETELREFKQTRERAAIPSTAFDVFKKQINYFPEMRLFHLIERDKAEYLRFVSFELALETWDYRKPVVYKDVTMHSTEIQVPCIEVDLAELVYGKSRQLGRVWAKTYVTEPTAQNEFIRTNGL